MSRKGHFWLGLAALALIFSYTPVRAENRPVQIALVTPLQIFPEEDPVTGIRLNLIYGRNVSITGIDLGLVNHTTEGMSLGAQFGMVGVADADFTGWQDNWVNVTKGRFEGLQWGTVNYAKNMNGLQLGLVNYAESMNGLQLGLVNIIRVGGVLPVLPIVNWSF